MSWRWVSGLGFTRRSLARPEAVAISELVRQGVKPHADYKFVPGIVTLYQIRVPDSHAGRVCPFFLVVNLECGS